MIYRRGKKEDVEEAFSLVEQVDARLLSPFKKTYNSDRSVIAQDDKKIVGVATWGKVENGEVVINWSFVHKQYQKQGICSKLVSLRSEVLKTQGVKYILSDVMDQFLIDHLEKQGFTRFKKNREKPLSGDLGYYQRMKKELQ